MSKTPDDTPDDLEAVRRITETLKPFDAVSQERIIRWAKEKLGSPLLSQAPPQEKSEVSSTQLHSTPRKKHVDIKTFVAEKKPVSDTHFAATVAYYYKFEAPESERKDTISVQDLPDTCRKVDRKRPKQPAQTLRNAYKQGLLDRIKEGVYSINTVGENLVAMTLPSGATAKPTARKKASKKLTKKAVTKKAEKQKNTKGK